MIAANDNGESFRRQHSIADVIAHVAFEFDRDIAAILSSDRTRRLVWARYAVAWLARRHVAGATLLEIERATGRHRHLIGADIARADALRQRDGYFAHLLDHINGLLAA